MVLHEIIPCNITFTPTNEFIVCFQVMDPSFRAQFGNVNRWFLTTVNQPQFKKVLGEVKLCETMAKFDGRSCTLCQNVSAGNP